MHISCFKDWNYFITIKKLHYYFSNYIVFSSFIEKILPVYVIKTC